MRQRNDIKYNSLCSDTTRQQDEMGKKNKTSIVTNLQQFEKRFGKEAASRIKDDHRLAEASRNIVRNPRFKGRLGPPPPKAPASPEPTVIQAGSPEDERKAGSRPATPGTPPAKRPSHGQEARSRSPSPEVIVVAEGKPPLERYWQAAAANLDRMIEENNRREQRLQREMEKLRAAENRAPLAQITELQENLRVAKIKDDNKRLCTKAAQRLRRLKEADLAAVLEPLLAQPGEPKDRLSQLVHQLGLKEGSQEQ